MAFSHWDNITQPITIGKNVNHIGKYAFNATNSPEIIVAPENNTYSSWNGMLFSKDKTELIACPKGKKGALTIPAGVTKIHSNAFYFSNCTGELKIPDSVVTIENQAFHYCEKLTGNLVIPEGVKTIGNYAFDGCANLCEIYIPASVTSIGKSAFGGVGYNIEVDSGNADYASLDGILFTKDLKTLIVCPFLRRGYIHIPETVTTIAEHAFSYCIF